MIKRFLTIFVIGTSMSFMISGCYYDKFQELHPSINTACDSASATYSNQVKQIVNTYCISCHSSGAASGGIVLDNYTSMKAMAASGMLMNALKGTGVPSMPPNTHLDDCKIGTIHHWVLTGAPNN